MATNNEKRNRYKQPIIPPTTINADVVFCVDATQSMAPFIDEAKKNIMSLYSRVNSAVIDQRRILNQFRIKVIVFRDLYYDYQPLIESNYYVMPNQINEFNEFINKINVDGGGDDEESGFEALAIAIDSKWVEKSNSGKVRHIIVVVSDNGAHKFEDTRRGTCVNYPSNMPNSYYELYDRWNDSEHHHLDQDGKRLIILAPEVYPWDKMRVEWNHVYFTKSNAGAGCPDPQMSIITKWVVKSMK